MTEEEEEEELPLNLLRLDPGSVGVESALSEIAKLRSLRAKPRHGWFTNPGSDDDQCASEAGGAGGKSSYGLSRSLP